ncbi:MAG: flagellar hook-associated protein FlgK [Lachnospiraceae bacterium]|nr:flagellar hook-associated protein FlgK [Lachnospiraceae bacterium]
MSSQFFGLMIGYSGLNAAATAENTVAHNIANKDTDGYSRQQVNTSAADALRVSASYGMAGAGVSIGSISQLRNSFYDIKYRNNESNYQYYETLELYASTIEKYFKDDTSTAGFGTIYSQDFFKALEDLSTNPSSTTTRTTFVGKAAALAEYFNIMYSNLQKSQRDVNYEIKAAVDRINNISEQIANLNKQINVLEISGMNANDLRDRRANLVDELSGYVDVKTTEVPIIDETTGHDTGTYNFIVTVCDGQSLVYGYMYNTLECKERDDAHKVNQTDTDGLYDLYWKNSGNSFKPSGGDLKGSLAALFLERDGNNSENLGGTTRPATATVSGTTATVTIDYSGETTNLDEIISKLNLNDQGTIKLKGSSFFYDGWELEYDDANSKLTINFNNISQDTQNNKITSVAEIIAAGTVKAEIGTSVAYKGIPYYMAQMNQWVRDFARIFNTIEKTGEDLDGNKLCEYDTTTGTYTSNTSFFVWNSRSPDPDKAGQRELIETNKDTATYLDTSTNKITSGDLTSYYNMTAGNLQVNEKIVDDVTKMSTTATDADINKDAADIVKELISIKTDTSKMEFRGSSSTNFLTIVLSDMAFASSSAKTFADNTENMKKSIESQRASVSGVDDEEEALDMIKFQRSYSLSSKMISIMAQIYDRLILETGV